MKFKKFERQSDRHNKRWQKVHAGQKKEHSYVAWLRAVKNQLTARAGQPAGHKDTPSNASVLFTKKAIAKLRDLGLREDDCLDVLRHGSVVKESMMVQKYNGFEIGVVSGKDSRTGQTIVFSAWKRERR